MPSDPADELLAALTEAVALLDRVGERHWAAWLRSGLEHLRRGDGYGLGHVLRAYGGMGSINDLVVHPMNGHDVRPEEVGPLNTELRALLSHPQASSLR